jgi:hypothetical protein
MPTVFKIFLQMEAFRLIGFRLAEGFLATGKRTASLPSLQRSAGHFPAGAVYESEERGIGAISRLGRLSAQDQL